MPFHAQLVEQGSDEERRSSGRRPLRLRAAGLSPSAAATSVFIHDLSETGLLIESSESLSLGDSIQVELAEIGEAKAEVVWSSGAFFGCKFGEPITRAGVSAAILRSPAPAAEDTYSSEADAGDVNYGADEDIAFMRGLIFAIPMGAVIWALIIIAILS